MSAIHISVDVSAITLASELRRQDDETREAWLHQLLSHLDTDAYRIVSEFLEDNPEGDVKYCAACKRITCKRIDINGKAVCEHCSAPVRW